MDKVQIKHVSVHQSAKVIAMMWFVATLVFLVPIGIIGYFFTGDKNSLVLVVLPLFYLIIGYIAQAIFFWFYNLIAGWVGGVEFMLEDQE